MPEEGAAGQTGQTGSTLTQSAGGGGQTGQSGQTGQGAGSNGQEGTVEWSKHIPADIAQDKIWEPYKGKGLGDVLKGYAEASKLIGSTLRVPKDDAKPEEWNAFYGKLGRPESPDKYQLPEDGTDKGMVDAFKTVAHELGLTQKQAAALMGFVSDRQAVRGDEENKMIARDLEALKKDWGGAYDRKITIAQRAVREFAGPDTVMMLDKTGLGNHPAMIRFMAAIGEYLAEDGTIPGDIRGAGSKEEALAKITAINSDPKHPYWNDGPGHKEAVAEMQRLFKVAHT